MTEELNQNNTVEEKIEQPKEEVVQQETPTEETQEQINWKKFREAREKDRKEKLEAQRLAEEKAKETEAIKQAMEQLIQENKSRSTQEEPDYFETEEERINKIIEKKWADRQQKEEEERRQREVQETPQRLRQSHPDFDQVCNADNLDYLEYHYPEVSKAFASMPDSFDKWDSIYKAVKKFAPTTNHKDMEARAEKNMAKPQSMSVPGSTATTDTVPKMLDDQRKQANWKRMMNTLKGL